MNKLLGITLAAVIGVGGAFWWSIPSDPQDRMRNALDEVRAAKASEAPAPLDPEIPAAPAPSPKVNYGISVVMFEKARLDECFSSYLTPSPGNELQAKALVEKRAAEVAEKVKAWKGGDKPLLLSKTCAEQFPDRPAFATCSTEKDVELGHKVETTYYFSMATLDADDAAMKECITAGGDWKVNPDRTLVERARIAEKQRKLEKMLSEAEATASQ